MRPELTLGLLALLIGGCSSPRPVAKTGLELFSAKDWPGLCALSPDRESEANGWTRDACPLLFASLAEGLPDNALVAGPVRRAPTFNEGERWFVAEFPNAPKPGSDLPPRAASELFLSELETKKGPRLLVADFALHLLRMGPNQDASARARRAAAALNASGLSRIVDLRTSMQATRERYEEIGRGERSPKRLWTPWR